MDNSIKGAQDKIIGLLNPDKGQTENNKKSEEPSEQPQGQEVKTEEVKTQEPVVAEKSNQTPTEEVTDEAISSENNTIETEATEIQESPKPSLHRVKVQGQELEVSLDELKAGYSRDSDYRQKTHALSQDKKTLEEQKHSFSQTYDSRLKELNDLIGTANAYVSQSSSEIDLPKLYEEDPVAAAKADFQMRQQKDHLNNLKSQADKIKSQQFNEYLTEQKRLAATKIPEYADPNKATTFKTQLKTTLADYGFTDSEIGSLADHRFLMVVKDAMEYKNYKGQKPVTSKKVVTAPKVIKSGISKGDSGRRDAVTQKLGRLKRTGKIQDAQSAILEIISKK
jgi:hypothetical protein